MKRYLIHATDGRYIHFIILKNTLRKESSNLLTVLLRDRHPLDKDFVNTTYFLTDNKREALVIENKGLAEFHAHKIDGYIEEIGV